MKVAVELLYTASSHTVVDLPEGKTWNDVADLYVKWGTVRIRFNGSDDYQDFESNEVTLDSVDFKYPDRTMVWPTDENGDANYDESLMEVDG